MAKPDHKFDSIDAIQCAGWNKDSSKGGFVSWQFKRSWKQDDNWKESKLSIPDYKLDALLAQVKSAIKIRDKK
jgi:hypothetical protein